ncbi:Phytochrome-like protein cph2 [Paraliobacillus sp. PM-2]|uniref:EAL domain-containing protein n=1 Tax=Paraliobacillus sp. PM-2 TaxID=1462524 RepID=UPI00061B8E85|nr:EAL domain-containing protein [Paraliobacillus sp. PM-2]CQR46762.1 Phytochrome-like protein cph2 [Paraliobacillus sp. PM-2]
MNDNPFNNFIRNLFKHLNQASYSNEKVDATTHSLEEAETKSSVTELEETIRTYEYMMDHIHAAIWMKDFETNTVTYASEGTEELFEMPLHDIYDNATVWEDIIHPEDKNNILHQQQALLKGETLYQQYRIQLPNGKVKWVYDQTIPWFNENDQLARIFGVLVDITKEKQLQQEINYLATYDQLTELPNYYRATNKLDKLIKQKKPFALLYFNIDRLSAINQSLGFKSGDQVIKEIATKLAHHAGLNFVARFNSNDFIIIIENETNKKKIFNLSDQIIQSMQEPILINRFELIVTISIGISFFPDDGDNATLLFEKAHKALQKAKEIGRNNYQTLSHKENISTYKQFILERDMREALINNDFELYYQPIINTKNGVIESAETLIRWNHKDWGLISPNDFIPLAEDNHLIHEIGDWVFEQVVKQLAFWKEQNLPLRPIAINISPTRFYRKGFLDFFKKTLETYQIPAKYITLEITKRLFIKDKANIIKMLKQLKQLGLKIAIDDFGVGYSFLEYLRDFEFDTIKIDKAFTQNMLETDSKDKAIITTILHLAKQLNIEVVAEGIETYEQYLFLKQKECPMLQGYILSKPVPLKTYEEMNKTGYVALPKPSSINKPEIERRKYHRFSFHSMIIGEMHITSVNKKKIDLAGTNILIENISLEGLKIMSHLDLPIQSQLQFKFTFTLMDETFVYPGKFIWKEEAGGNIFYYGIHFPNIDEQQKDHLAKYLNKMSVLEKKKEKMDGTNFSNENPFLFFDNIKKNAKASD